MNKRLQRLGIVLALLGSRSSPPAATRSIKTQAGANALQAFSAAQNVKLSYNDQGSSSTAARPPGPRRSWPSWSTSGGTRSTTASSTRMTRSSTRPASTCTRWPRSPTTPFRRPDRRLPEDVRRRRHGRTKAGTYEFQNDGKYWTGFDRTNPIEGAAREQAWTARPLRSSPSSASAAHRLRPPARPRDRGTLRGDRHLPLITGLGLVWATRASTEKAKVPAFKQWPTPPDPTARRAKDRATRTARAPPPPFRHSPGHEHASSSDGSAVMRAGTNPLGAGPRISLTARQLNRATLARQLLLRREPLSVVDASRVVALQAQEPASPYLALWNRLDPFDPADLDAAFAEHTVVKATLMRLTLHAVDARTTRPSRTRCCRPCGRPGSVTAGSSHRADHRGRRRAGPDLASSPPAADEPEVEAMLAERIGAPSNPRLWWALRQYAPICTHPPAGRGRSDPAGVPRGPAARPAADQDGALRTLVRRYLAGFGPASVADVAQFALVPRRRCGRRSRSSATSWSRSGPGRRGAARHRRRAADRTGTPRRRRG